MFSQEKPSGVPSFQEGFYLLHNLGTWHLSCSAYFIDSIVIMKHFENLLFKGIIPQNREGGETMEERKFDLDVKEILFRQMKELEEEGKKTQDVHVKISIAGEIDRIANTILIRIND